MVRDGFATCCRPFLNGSGEGGMTEQQAWSPRSTGGSCARFVNSIRGHAWHNRIGGIACMCDGLIYPHAPYYRYKIPQHTGFRAAFYHARAISPSVYSPWTSNFTPFQGLQSAQVSLFFVKTTPCNPHLGVSSAQTRYFIGAQKLHSPQLVSTPRQPTSRPLALWCA